MKSNLYLYNTTEVPEIPAEVVVRRLELLKDNLAELLEHSYHIRDYERVAEVLEAISFWQDLPLQ